MSFLNLEPEQIISEKRRNLFALISLSVILFIIYSNTFQASWHFDDTKIVENPSLHLSSFAWEEIKKTFFSHPLRPERPYRPVACFSFALNYYFSGNSVFSYHVVNLLIHFLTATFLFLFVYETLKLPLIRPRYGEHAFSIALLATVLWAAHPIQTQAVTYIIQRMASMAGMFYILSLYLYLKARISGTLRSKVVYFSTFCLSGLMAMGSKENAFMLPIVVYLYDLFLIRGVSGANFRRHLKYISVILLFTICAGVAYYIISRSDGPFLWRYNSRLFSLEERLLSQPTIVLFYLSLVFYPLSSRFSVVHDITISKGLLDPPTTLLAIVAIVTVVGTALYFSKRRPLVAFSILFFFLNHTIESSFLPLELVFEHRNYIPTMFLFVPLAYLLLRGIYHVKFGQTVRVCLGVFVTALIIMQGLSTFMRNGDWKTDVSLWMAATETAPALWRPWHNVGNAYSQMNMHEKAMVYYQEALLREPSVNRADKALTFYNMGVRYNQLGEKDKAMAQYRQAEAIKSNHSFTHNNKGVLFAQEGRQAEALHEFEQAIRYAKNDPEPYSNLGSLLLEMGQVTDAIEKLQIAVRLRPDHPNATKLLAETYKKSGQYGKALILYKKSSKLAPRNLDVWIHLAEIYAARGMDDKAEASLDHFIKKAKDIHLHSVLKKSNAFETDILVRLFSKLYADKSSLLSEMEEFLDQHRPIVEVKKEQHVVEGMNLRTDG
jgi:tetratricopeptide (TPR) repeat protein